jgi:predicted AAA+ superfamily ATPase
MITREEITKGAEIPKEYEANLLKLLEIMNLIRAKYGKIMRITSGFRSESEHLRIYREKGITDKKKIPMKSKHLRALAADVADADGKLNAWCKENEEWLRSIGVWLETRQGGWQHFQIEAFGSYKPKGTIWFNP